MLTLGPLILFFIFLWNASIAQTGQELFIKEKLEAEGINEAEFKRRLHQKGVDLDNLVRLSPEEASAYQVIIEETIHEMTQVDLKSHSQPQAPPQTDSSSDQQQVKSVPITTSLSSGTEDTIPTRKVEIYGQQLFRSYSGKSAQELNRSQPPAHYKLGPEDELVVSIWGLSQVDEKLTISDQGYVRPYRMPRIHLKGRTFSMARNILKDRYAEFYNFRSNEFDVTVNYSRQIDVTVYGEVKRYGSLTVPAVSNIYDILGLVGGPTDVGSMRKIRLIRGNTSQVIDLYEFILDPDNAKDIFLEQNDIIMVPVADKVVTVEGHVSRPFKYEILDKEGLKEAIALAGGMRAGARPDRIEILRFTNERQIALEVNYEKLIKDETNFGLQDGDVIRVRSVIPKVENEVSISGEVRYPGFYPRKEDMDIRQLLERAVLMESARTDISFLRRVNKDGTIRLMKVDLDRILEDSARVLLEDGDELLIYARSRFVDSTYFKVSGAVREPGSFDFDRSGNISVYDAIVLSGGLEANASKFGYVLRKSYPTDDNLSYVRVDLDKVLNQPTGTDNIILSPFDELVIGESGAMDDQMYFDVIGAVRQPGRYQYGEGITLADAIRLSGGFTFSAASNRIDLFRVDLTDNKPTKTRLATYEIGRNLEILNNRAEVALLPYDQVVVRDVPEFELQQNVHIEGEVIYPGLYAISESNERMANMISRAGGLTMEAFPSGATLYRTYDSVGFVVINLEEAIKNAGSKFNVILKDGDRIVVPKQQNLVRITGHTNARELYPEKVLNDKKGIAVPYHPGKNAKFYIDKFAAGVSTDGSICLITVEHANGQIEHTRNYGIFKSYPRVRPGATIRVGKKEERKTKDGRTSDSEDVDWGQVFSNSIAQATTILSLILLIQRID